MTATNPSDTSTACRDCGALLSSGAEECWLCGARQERLAAIAESPREFPAAVNPYASPPLPAGANLNRTFSLSTMFLWTTLVAVMVGAGTIHPALAFYLALLTVPAALRTVGIAVRRKRRRGERMSAVEKIGAFFSSMGLVLVIEVAAYIAFCAVCFPIGLAGFGAAEHGDAAGSMVMGFAVIAGSAAGITVAYFLIRAYWRKD
jgi:ribosomal protein L40E